MVASLTGAEHELDFVTIRDEVSERIDDYLNRQAATATLPQMTTIIDLVRDFVGAGGKRLRPLLCYCGWAAAGGGTDRVTVSRVAASLELFHAFTLIHDDIMDASDQRRGRPTVHRAMTTLRESERGHADARTFGTNGGILVGDLALVWSDDLLDDSGLSPAQFTALRPLISTMRTEVMLGQYLDLLSTGALEEDLGAAMHIVRYKTAKYTVERPLQIGAALAGARPELMAACSAYAIPVGEAFQLRDDLLGVFGDPASTGKSNREDLREGKSTALIAIALHRATAAQRATLRQLVGNPDLDEAGADTVREILLASGSCAQVESMIWERRERSMAVLADGPFAPPAVRALRSLALAATERGL